MKCFDSFEQFSREAGQIAQARPVVSVGSFDGVHLGHQYLLNELVEWARREKAPSVVVTFTLHPREMMTGEEVPSLTSSAHKRRLLEAHGIDAVLMLEFDANLREVSASSFMQRHVQQILGARGMLVGFNNRIGKDGEGTFKVLQDVGDMIGVEVREAERVEVSGEAMSSSTIRSHVANGDFLWARKMLGRPYSIVGEVIEGDKRGRTIGFPTANVSLNGLAFPPLGVYGVSVRLNGETRTGAANIGTRPTVDPGRVTPLLEVHLPGFEGDLYGREIEVEFLFHLRGEQKFGSIDELKARLEQDVAEITRRVKDGDF